MLLLWNFFSFHVSLKFTKEDIRFVSLTSHASFAQNSKIDLNEKLKLCILTLSKINLKFWPQPKLLLDFWLSALIC